MRCGRFLVLPSALCLILFLAGAAGGATAPGAGWSLLYQWQEVIPVGGQPFLADGRQYVDPATGQEHTFYYDGQGAVVAAGPDISWLNSTPAQAAGEHKPGAYVPVKKALPFAPPAWDSCSVSVALPPLDAQTIRAKKAAIEKAELIGLRRSLPAPVAVGEAPNPGAAWKGLGRGGNLWSLAFTAEQSHGLRFHLESVNLPAGCAVWVYDARDPDQVLGPYGMDACFGDTDFWTATIFTDQAILACEVPLGVDIGAVAFRISEVVDRFVDVGELFPRQVGNCHNDVACYPAWSNQAAAVAGIGSIGVAGELWCTGCLVSDSNPSTYVDYFMTANHCVGSQSEASDTEFYWFYQASQCHGTVPNPRNVPRTSGGATYLAGMTYQSANDFALLQLRQASPAGVYYVGWTTARPSTSETLTCIHHPDGSYKRISFGKLEWDDTNWLTVQWHSGVTEPGSSGSPLFDAAGRFVGQLYGGESACEYMAGLDEYGRFTVTYPVVKKWLGEDWNSSAFPWEMFIPAFKSHRSK